MVSKSSRRDCSTAPPSRKRRAVLRQAHRSAGAVLGAEADDDVPATGGEGLSLGNNSLGVAVLALALDLLGVPGNGGPGDLDVLLHVVAAVDASAVGAAVAQAPAAAVLVAEGDVAREAVEVLEAVLEGVLAGGAVVGDVADDLDLFISQLASALGDFHGVGSGLGIHTGAGTPEGTMMSVRSMPSVPLVTMVVVGGAAVPPATKAAASRERMQGREGIFLFDEVLSWIFVLLAMGGVWMSLSLVVRGWFVWSRVRTAVSKSWPNPLINRFWDCKLRSK